MRRGTMVLLLAVIAFGLYIGFFERKQDTTEKRRQIARRVLRMDSTRITGIRVMEPDLQFTAEKSNDHWRLISPITTRADGGEIGRIIDAFAQLERSDVIRGKDQRKQGLTLADFGLDQPRVRVTLTAPEREWTILVGNNTPVGGNLFIKEAGDSSVFITSTNLIADLPAAVNTLRDHRLFRGTPSDVTRLDARRGEGPLNLARAESGTWKMQQPWSGRTTLGAVQNLLDRLFASRIEDFIAESFDAASLYGLDEPAVQVSLLGDRKYGEQTLLIGKPVDQNTNQVYATLSGESTVFTVNHALLSALMVKAESLRDRRLLTRLPRDINFIRVEENERAILLSRTGSGGWEILEPIRHQADAGRVEGALAEWTGASIEKFLDTAGTNYADWGIESPARRITFSHSAPASATNEASATKLATLDDEAIVLLSTRPPTNKLVVVKLAGEETLYKIDAALSDTLPTFALWYRNPEVLTLDPATIRSITISQGGNEESVLRESATNEFRAASSTNTADAKTAAEILGVISALRAVAFVADTVTDLRPYGLDEPLAQLTVGLQGGGAPTRTLLFGNEDAAGNSYAILRGGDAVFTLSSGTRDKLLATLYKLAKPKEPQVATPLPRPSEDAEPDSE